MPAKKAKKQMTKRPNKAKVVQRQAPKQKKKQAKSSGGGYSSSIGSTLGGLAGTAIGTMFGNPIAGGALGAGLGGMGGKLFGQMTGLGDYEIEKNTLVSDPPPMYNNVVTKNGGIVCRHREYLGDIITSATANTFSIQSFPINPGQSNTFPWLSQVAQNYEQWSPEGIVFEYRSMSADALNSVNTALGTVIMATNYNSGNPLFASKSEMENYEFGQSCKPSCSAMHLVECARNQTVLSDLYVRPALVPFNGNVQFFDLGLFQIATSGFQGTSVNIGELWVTYEVLLMKPKLYASLGNGIQTYSAYWQTAVGGSAPTSAAPLQSIGGNSTTNFAGIIYTNMTNTHSSNLLANNVDFYFTATTFFFPGWLDQPISFFIQLVWDGSSTTVVGFSCTGTNCTVNTTWLTVANTGTATQLVQNIAVQSNANGLIPQVVLSAGTIPASCSQATLIVNQMGNQQFNAIQAQTAVAGP